MRVVLLTEEKCICVKITQNGSQVFYGKSFESEKRLFIHFVQKHKKIASPIAQRGDNI